MLENEHCVPAKGQALRGEEITQMMVNLTGWEVSADEQWLMRHYIFDNFAEALAFVNKLGAVAEAERHHPDMELGWGYVNVKLQTHDVGGLSRNDFIMAAKINTLKP